MSGGNNKSFMADPLAFLNSDKVWDVNSTGVNGAQQPIYVLDGNGVGTFNLDPYSAHTISLKQHTPKIGRNKLKAYYLNASANSTQSMVLSNHADYFFTDTIQGCSFHAYGTSRNRLTVEHVNDLNHTTPSADYATAALRVQNLGNAITIIYDNATYRQLTNPEWDGTNVVVTVIGWRKTDGWHFYARRRLNGYNDTGGRRSLGPAFELT